MEEGRSVIGDWQIPHSGPNYEHAKLVLTKNHKNYSAMMYEVLYKYSYKLYVCNIGKQS